MVGSWCSNVFWKKSPGPAADTERLRKKNKDRTRDKRRNKEPGDAGEDKELQLSIMEPAYKDLFLLLHIFFIEQ